MILLKYITFNNKIIKLQMKFIQWTLNSITCTKFYLIQNLT